MSVEAFESGQERDEWVPLPEGTAEFEAARKRQGWLELSKEIDQVRGQWHYRWRYAPDELRAGGQKRQLLSGLVVLVVAVLIVIGVTIAVNNRDGGSSSSDASAPSSEPHVPINSEGKPAVGPIPAPADDPCWRQTEEAVEISPSDGGQSAMPQRCIDKGF